MNVLLSTCMSVIVCLYECIIVYLYECVIVCLYEFVFVIARAVLLADYVTTGNGGKNGVHCGL